MRPLLRGLAAAVLAAATALPAAAAPHPQDAARANGPVPGSWIVTLRAGLQADAAAGAHSAGQASKDLTDRYGGTVSHVYGTALNGFAARFGNDQAERLAADPAVASVRQDTRVHIEAAQADPPSWGLDRIDQPALPLDSVYHYPDTAGAGVTAYVIDTGIRTTHSDFGGRARSGYDFVDGDADAQDGNGHGTHVAGTIAGSAHGVAKRASLVAVRVLDDSGGGTASDVIAGIDWVTAHARRPAVVNMSVGGGIDPDIDTAVRNSIAAGISYAVAAGNEGADASGTSPARVPEALTVGATTRTDARAGYSNFGQGVDLFAPGSDITSDWSTGDTATHTLSGTSMATPHVAGAAALYLAGHPMATPAQVAGALIAAAARGRLGDVGSGSPNRLLQTTG
ncbi:S8 family peptidase [Peterkaempfera sp. SMS 1(5)a]|uniref:S8 family peptidase n=1 Tax=Peterkaempfera podocarpi TaxID=3232308 RepID=UPI00366B5C2E